MVELTVTLPLAQLNTSSGTATGPAPAPVTATGVGPGAGTGPETGSSTAPGTTTTTSAPAARPQNPGLFGDPMTMMLMVAMLVMVYFVFTRGPRKEEKRRKSMLADLKKGDRVMTIGGMLASVVSVDDDKVVLKIDESNNVKATYRKSAIQEVIDRDEKKS